MKNKTFIYIVAVNLAALILLAIFSPQLMISPGKPIDAHAELATDCFACHTPFIGSPPEKCIACHKVGEIGKITTKGLPIEKEKKNVAFHQELIKGCIVTIDAMGCQRAIAEQIIAQEGDYVLGLKGNQGTLHEAVEDFFNTAQANKFVGIAHDHSEEVDKGHGRLETRRYWITETLCTLPDIDKWQGLRRA